MLNENVIKVLNESMWDLATCADGRPNVVPVAFKEIDEEGNLHIGDVFLQTTLANLKANGGRIALSAYNPKTLEGYQIKGRQPTRPRAPTSRSSRARSSPCSRVQPLPRARSRSCRMRSSSRRRVPTTRRCSSSAA